MRAFQILFGQTVVEECPLSRTQLAMLLFLIDSQAPRLLRPHPSFTLRISKGCPHSFGERSSSHTSLRDSLLTNVFLQCAAPNSKYSLQSATDAHCRIRFTSSTTTFLRVFTAFRRVFWLECLHHASVQPTSLFLSLSTSSSRLHAHYGLRLSDTDQHCRRITFQLTFHSRNYFVSSFRVF